MKKVSDALQPILFPVKFVEYWGHHFLINEGNQGKPCDYCPEEIMPGDRYFKVEWSPTEPALFGHLTHLKEAPPQEFVKDPRKTVRQPWETDPGVPAPAGWEEWKRKHEWAV